MEKKKKNLGAPRLKSMPFLFIWIVAHMGVWFVLYSLGEMDSFYRWNEFVVFTAFGIIMGLGLSLMQKGLIQFTYHDTLKWWLAVTIGGWILGWAGFYFFFDMLEDLFRDAPLGLLLIPLFVTPALMQWIVLRENTRHAWLWIVAGAASSLAFGALYGEVNGDELYQFMFGAIAQGAVTGLALLWLYGQSRTEKIKSGLAKD